MPRAASAGSNAGFGASVAGTRGACSASGAWQPRQLSAERGSLSSISTSWPATPGPMDRAWRLVVQSASCAGWQVPHASGASDASSGEKRAGGGPCGASGACQWWVRNVSKDSTPARDVAAAQPARASASASQKRDRMSFTIAGLQATHVRADLADPVTILLVHVARVTGIGWKARAALDGGGVARVLAPLSASIYITVDADILWLGPAGATPHPRAILCADPLEPGAIEPGALVRVDATGVAPWRSAEVPATRDAAAALTRGAARLGAAAQALGAPEGFGTLLVDARPGFPLEAAAARARALASACAADRPAEAAQAAWALLGLGAGLTPSGDDYVGGAFFARA